MKWLLLYLLAGLCESIVGHDGVVGGNLLSILGYSIFWLPINVILAVKVLMHPGEEIIDKEYDDD